METQMEKIDLELIKNLEHGSNKQQIATLNKSQDIIDYETEYELTYNDILGMSKALEILSEFYDVQCAVLTRTSRIIGAALGVDLYDALVKAIDCNPIDSLSAVVGFSSTVDKKTATQITSSHLVLAPDFEDDAIDLFEKHSVRYVKINTPLKDTKNYSNDDLKITLFGTLLQDTNKSELNQKDFKVVTKTKPTVEQIEDGVFAWKVAKYAKSNAVVIAKDLKVRSISQGQLSQAMEIAINYAADTVKETVMASDTTISVTDFNAALQNRISVFILPGVTQEIINLADKYEKVIITTGFTNILD